MLPQLPLLLLLQQLLKIPLQAAAAATMLVTHRTKRLYIRVLPCCCCHSC
jgi:hypothetical protein